MCVKVISSDPCLRRVGLKESFCLSFSCVQEFVSSATNEDIYRLSNNGRPSPTLGDDAYPHCARSPTRKEIDVTYYRVDFVAAKLISRPAKRFRTEEKAKKHARRVLGVADDGDLATRVAIVAVSRNGTPI